MAAVTVLKAAEAAVAQVVAPWLVFRGTLVHTLSFSKYEVRCCFKSFLFLHKVVNFWQIVEDGLLGVDTSTGKVGAVAFLLLFHRVAH